MEQDEKFSNLASVAAKILGLAPSVLCSDTFNINAGKKSFVGKMYLAVSKYKSYQPQRQQL